MICGAAKAVVFDDTLSTDKIQLFDQKIERSGDKGKGHQGFAYHKGDSEVVPYDRNEPLVAVIDEFFSSIAEDREPLTDGSAGLRTVRILEAVERSITQYGARVEVT